MSIADRAKGEKLTRKFGAPKTAHIIATECYERIFAAAIEEIGIPKLVGALVEAKNADWAFCALRYIPDLTGPQRTALKHTIVVATTDAGSAFFALRYIPDLTETQRSALQKIARAA